MPRLNLFHHDSTTHDHLENQYGRECWHSGKVPTFMIFAPLPTNKHTHKHNPFQAPFFTPLTSSRSLNSTNFLFFPSIFLSLIPSTHFTRTFSSSSSKSL